MAGNPLTNENWAAEFADTVERLVGTVRDKATRPAVRGARGLVFGIMAGLLAIVAVALVLIALTRGLQTLLDLFLTWEQAVYVSYFLIGGILCLAGVFVLRMRRAPEL